MRHPLHGLYEAVAATGRPPDGELDALAADLARNGTMTATAIRQRLGRTVDQIVAARDVGESGRARTIARDSALDLAGELGDYSPAPAPERPIADVIAGIGRGVGADTPPPDVAAVLNRVPRRI